MLTEYNAKYWKVMNMFKDEILKATKCMMPCTFMEYKVSEIFNYIMKSKTIQIYTL